MVKILILESSLVAKWLGFQAFTAPAQVQSLVGELKSPTSCTAWPKKKKKTKSISHKRLGIYAEQYDLRSSDGVVFFVMGMGMEN